MAKLADNTIERSRWVIGSGGDYGTLESRQEDGLSIAESSSREDGKLDFYMTYPFF